MHLRLFIIIAVFFAIGSILLFPSQGLAKDHIVYSVYTELNFGNPGEVSRKDFYVDMGTKNGLKVGSRLQVYRKVSSYDLITKRLQADVRFAFATLRVIHAEGTTAIARLDKMAPSASTPIASPNAVIIGDTVKIKK